MDTSGPKKRQGGACLGFLFAFLSQTGDWRSRQPGNANGPREKPAFSSQRAREGTAWQDRNSQTITTLLQPDTTEEMEPTPTMPTKATLPLAPRRGAPAPRPGRCQEARQGARTSIPTQQVIGLLTLPVGAMSEWDIWKAELPCTPHRHFPPEVSIMAKWGACTSTST